MGDSASERKRRLNDGAPPDVAKYEATIRKLGESRALLRAVFENVTQGIIFADESGRISGFNPAAELLFGLDEEAVVGRQLADIFKGRSEAGGLNGEIEKLFAPGRIEFGRSLTTEVIGPQGQPTPVELVAHRAASRERAIVTVFVRNISETVNAEKKLRTAHARAKKATEARTRYLATMSHEVRTPLNAVLGSLDLLADSDLSDSQRRWLEAARLSGRAVKNVTDDIIDLAAIESGHLVINPAPFNLLELVEETAHAVAPGAYAKGLEIALLVEPDVPTAVTGDIRRLQQVLLNFTSNAIKFTESGAVTLRVECLRRDSDAALVRFWVTDTGIGIPKSQQERLFQEFFRGDVTSDREFEGSGLGLAISKTLISAMNGDVGIEDGKEGGSRFWFSARLEIGEGEQMSFQSNPISTPGHCLVVQPNRVSANTIRRQLMAWGKKTLVADSSEKAFSYVIEQAQKGRPVTDVLIDVEEAQRNAAQWREWSLRDDAPSIVLLARPETSDSREVSEAVGPSVCIAKPVRTTDLWLYNSRKDCFVNAARRQNTEATLKGLKRLAEATAFAGARILLAEDSEVNQMVVKAMLETENFIVDVVSNGAEAIEAAIDSAYDLILMDIVMPGMNGVQATEQIRARLKGRCPPIIALTGNAFDDDRTRCAKAGMQGFMLKPVDKVQLLSNVEAVLNQTGTWRALDDGPGVYAAPDEGSEPADALDPVVVEQLRAQIGEAKANAVIRQFINEAKGLVEQIANESLDARSRMIAAHTLKSAAATFGMSRLQALAADIERSYGSDDLRRVGLLLPKLKAASEPLRKTFANH